MDNITIGIVMNKDEVDNKIFDQINNNNLKYLHNKCNYFGILSYEDTLDNMEILSICDGIIIPGGTNIYPYHFQILEYAIKNNIPLLGICMGHQIIGLNSINSRNQEDLIMVTNHNNKKHSINIKDNTLLYKLFGNNIVVNSRHNFALSKVDNPFKVTAISEDNIIEAIEYIDDDNFIIGLQFHPEDMDNTENLYNFFIKEILRRKK